MPAIPPAMVSSRRLTSAVLVLAGMLLFPVAAARAQTTAVQPINWASFTVPYPSDTNATIQRNILRNSNKYAVTTWYDTVKNYDAQTNNYLSLGGTLEQHIRPPAAQAYALAVSIKLGLYDPALTGVPLVDAKARTVRLINSIAFRHRANTAGGWGNAWQSAHWASYAGTAGWLMWDEFQPADQEYVRRMVESEANRFVNYTVPYYRNAAGVLVSSGDTKAEENAWNAQILHLAVNMMPNHPQRTAWMRKCLELMVSAFSRPSDLNNTAVINGRQVRQWLNGSNANEDGTVVNHAIIHPDYIVTAVNTAEAAIHFSLAGQPTPSAALFNADRCYDAMVDLVFPSPPFAAPGGTIYIVGSSNLYYPQGNDWGTSRKMNYASFNAMARAFGFDNLSARKGDYWEALHGQAALDMQARSSDGRTYITPEEDTYAGREEWVAQAAAIACLSKWVVANNLFSLTNGNVGEFPPPGAPSGLSAEVVSASEVRLTWTDNATDEIAFKLERKTGAGGVYAEVATLGENATSAIDTGLSLDTPYFYRVRATSVVGYSAYSAEAGITIHLEPAVILSPPQAQTVALGAPATFTVSAGGIPVPTLQWYRGTNLIPGATGTSYTTPAATAADHGAVFSVVASNSLAVAPSTAAALGVRGQTLNEWRTAHFSFPTVNDPSREASVWGNAADPDGDRQSNLLEYALAGQPAQPSGPAAAAAGREEGRFALSFLRLHPATVDYRVQSSTNLADWSTIATLAAGSNAWTGAATVTETGQGPTRAVRLVEPPAAQDSPGRFFRVQVGSGEPIFTRPPLADSFTRDGTNATVNYGAATNLQVKLDGVSFARETFLRFDITGVPTNVSRAALFVNTLSRGTTVPTQVLVKTATNWSEGTLNWNNRPATLGGSIATWQPPVAGADAEIDVTTVVRAARAAGEAALSLRIYSVTAGSQAAVDYASREHPDAGRRPEMKFFLP